MDRSYNNDVHISNADRVYVYRDVIDRSRDNREDTYTDVVEWEMEDQIGLENREHTYACASLVMYRDIILMVCRDVDVLVANREYRVIGQLDCGVKKYTDKGTGMRVRLNSDRCVYMCEGMMYMVNDMGSVCMFDVDGIISVLQSQIEGGKELRRFGHSDVYSGLEGMIIDCVVYHMKYDGSAVGKDRKWFKRRMYTAGSDGLVGNVMSRSRTRWEEGGER